MSRRERRSRTSASTAAPRPSAAAGRPRVPAVDALRGLALCLMFVYHFAFDLRFYRVIAADFEHDPFWLGFRALIVAAFMLLVGVSMVLADRAGATRGHFLKRVGVIALCALAASAGSFFLFPRSFIYFGILHCIAVASVLARPLVRRPHAALVIGCVAIVAGVAWSHPVFDARALSWLGFTTMKPATEDFVPLAPWAGVVLVGVALGQVLARHGFRAIAPFAGAPAPLRWLGRHSLPVYMLHQPVFLGALWLVLGY